jgi:hypothetical protein
MMISLLMRVMCRLTSIKSLLSIFLAWHPPNQDLEEKWIPPPPNWVKLNFDIAIRDSYSTQAMVCKDSLGRILHLSTNLSPSCTPNVGEARAALLACSIVASLSYDKFILEGDSEVVVLSLKHPNSVQDWRISSVILDCLDYIPPTSSWEVRKVKRSANFCVHSVAHWATVGFHSGSIPISSFPFIISSPPVVKILFLFIFCSSFLVVFLQ